MKPRKVARVLFAAVLLLGILSADAAASTQSAPLEPWTIEHVVMHPEAQVGATVSIAHYPTTGTIFASYYDGVQGDLKLAYQVAPGMGNCSANSDWYCEIIDSVGNVGLFSSIDIIRVSANPPMPTYTKIGISYYDATNGALKFAQYSTLTGSWSKQVVDDTDGVGDSIGSYSSFKYGVDHQPFIAYHSLINYSAGGIKHASYVGGGSGNCGESDNWQCETIDAMADEPGYGTHISVDADYEGVIEVAFYDSFNSQLIWAHYQGFGGSCSNSAWNCVVVDGAGAVGRFVSIAARRSSADRLKFTYLDETVSRKIKYAVAVGSGGNCTSSSFNCFDVDDIGYPAGNVGLSMDVDALGKPIIAYMSAYNDALPLRLKIARPAQVVGVGAGNCGEQYPGDLFNYFYCKVIDPGASYADEAKYAAVSTAPSGLAAVVYSENNTQSSETYLKVALQHFTVYLPVIRK